MTNDLAPTNEDWKITLKELATTATGPEQTSVYMPVLAADPEHNRIQLKNVATRLDDALSDERRSPKRAILKRLERAAESAHATSPGVAVFSDGARLSLLHLPETPRPMVHVGEDALLSPLVRYIGRPEAMTVLALSINRVRLIEVDAAGAVEIPWPEQAPRSLADALGAQLTDASLQYHTGSRAGVLHYHGQGAGEQERKPEIAKYFAIVDAVLTGKHKPGATPLVSTKRPLLLAGVEFICAIFRDVTSLKNIVAESIDGNHDASTPEELADRARAWAARKKAEKVDRDAFDSSPPMVPLTVERATHAARQGRVARLQIPVVSDPEMLARVNECLVQTLRHGGELEPATRMRSTKAVAAELRW